MPLDGTVYRLETAPGVFSPDHVDLGTTVLLDTVDAPPPGRLLDLGCGWGPIALTAALREPRVEVTAVDVNERALDLLARNAERVRAAATAAGIDCGSVAALTPERVHGSVTFTTIWSNPPIRIGKDALHELLGAWLPRLESGGEAWLVVQKHLGADSLAAWLADQTDDAGRPWGEVERMRSSKGFRVLRLTRA